MKKQKIRKAVKIALLLGAITSPITTQPLIGKGELVEKLVAVGVRDISHDEAVAMQSSPKCEVFLSEQLAAERGLEKVE